MGYAPIPPVGPDFEVAMARTNDVILYGGTVYLTVDSDDEAKLRELVKDAPSINSKDYGKPFLQIFLDAGKDFYKIDPSLFAPAVLMINNAKTGRTFKAGQINPKVFSPSFGLLNFSFFYCIFTLDIIAIVNCDCNGYCVGSYNGVEECTEGQEC